MPVITLPFDRLMALTEGKASKEELVEKIPYLGVTLEEVTDEYVRVEYNPNRPDFSTSYGIVRALKGLLGFERGTPSYSISQGEVEVTVDESTQGVRPFVVSLVAKGLALTDEFIREMISMQEDLDGGIGRRRRKTSIGLHDFDKIRPPITYTTVDAEFEFVPLGYAEPISIREILARTEVGREYGGILRGFQRYRIFLDAEQRALSFPPIINAELTRVTQNTKNLFVEITATDLGAVEDVLAILASTLHDAGAQIEAVKVRTEDSAHFTPNMEPQRMVIDGNLVKKLLGLKLTDQEIVECLERSRISVVPEGDELVALIPRYRADVLHPMDLVEEVAYGYGFENLTPTLPASKGSGKPDRKLSLLKVVRDAMIGFGFIEVMNYSLVSRQALYELVNRGSKNIVKVENPKSLEHEALRDVLFPSLLTNLARNLHEEFPQRIFEVSKVFVRDGRAPSGLREVDHLAAAVAHSQANYTEAKSYLTSLLSQAFNLMVDTLPTYHPSFARGRTAMVRLLDSKVGLVGEVAPSVLQNFKLRTPVSLFELDMGKVVGAVGRKA